MVEDGFVDVVKLLIINGLFVVGVRGEWNKKRFGRIVWNSSYYYYYERANTDSKVLTCSFNIAVSFVYRYCEK